MTIIPETLMILHQEDNEKQVRLPFAPREVLKLGCNSPRQTSDFVLLNYM